MASHRSSLRHPIITVATALAGALGLGGCGAFGLGQTTEESAAPSTSTAEAISPQPEATADQTSAGYTVEQVRAAVATVDSEDSPLELSVTETRQVAPWEAEMDPSACEEAWRSADEFLSQHAGTPVVSANGDADRVQVEATVFADGQTAASAAELEARLLGGDCQQYAVIRGQSGYTREWTNTAFPVQLPDAAQAVTAATSEAVSTDPGLNLDDRHSKVQAVAGNVLVVVTYGAPTRGDGSADLNAVPVQAERAAAERAARQVITALVG